LLALAPFLGSAGVAAPEPPPRLSPAQRRLAAFGGRLVASDPAAAEELERFAVWTARSTGADDVDAVCAALLADARIAAELRRGVVHRVDGWLLARSEASACVYLHRLARAHPEH
jgi:hypothetical protein